MILSQLRGVLASNITVWGTLTPIGIGAEAGVQEPNLLRHPMDSGLRRNDGTEIDTLPQLPVIWDNRASAGGLAPSYSVAVAPVLIRGFESSLANTWQFWLALAVSVLFLLFLVYQVDLGEIRSALGDANYLFVVPAVALYFVAVYFRAVRWRFLLSPLRLIPVRRLYPVIVIGYMANNVLPARLGELVRSYYLARREQFNTSSALATVAVERVYDGVTLLAFAAFAGPVLLALGWFSNSSDTSRTTWLENLRSLWFCW